MISNNQIAAYALSFDERLHLFADSPRLASNKTQTRATDGSSGVHSRVSGSENDQTIVIRKAARFVAPVLFVKAELRKAELRSHRNDGRA